MLLLFVYIITSSICWYNISLGNYFSRPKKMAASATSRDVVKLISLCMAWYVASSANNIVGKMILSDFPYPMTVTMVQLISITIYSVPILKLWSIPEATNIPLKYWFSMILPLAFGKFFASVSSHISIWKVPVSYAHTGKNIIFRTHFSSVASCQASTCSMFPSWWIHMNSRESFVD